ncbi:uncharacterized protein CCOS01_12639 [Colletotrichum costaricense]|uniref:RING-type domain-containing protein n=1 Tax=Colletotrichum costaricense TaxID=1209916 RepID=A0AAI9YNA9_9PEZI|nr:uncharacterized protein CCOS01_12639 [Colletotrichum costaricense]KAK1517090.1 hypothetical protein CCOS01_12639 [Colletotrichum costaricense]
MDRETLQKLRNMHFGGGSGGGLGGASSGGSQGAPSVVGSVDESLDIGEGNDAFTGNRWDSVPSAQAGRPLIGAPHQIPPQSLQQSQRPSAYPSGYPSQQPVPPYMPVGQGPVDRLVPSDAAAMTDKREVIRKVFWPEIKSWMTSDTALQQFAAPCPKCSTSMTTTPGQNSNRAMVLVCGHILCEACIKQIANLYNLGQPKCPYCPGLIGPYSQCAQSCMDVGMMGLPLPGSMTELDKFPLTTPEGASRPSCCFTCRALRIERATNSLMRAILSETRSRAVWAPRYDHKADGKDYSDYKRVPALDNLMRQIRDIAHSDYIYQKYTWLTPTAEQKRQEAWVEMLDTGRHVS